MWNPFRRRRGPEAPAEPLAPVTPELEAHLVEQARIQVRPGFRTRADVLEVLGDEPGVDPAGLAAAVRRIVDREWEARIAELVADPGPGDDARLDAAFAELARRGILTRMDFTCCLTCGTDEIDDERDGEWAYAFAHQQDVERLADPDPVLMLAYSSFEPGPDADPADRETWSGGTREERRAVAARTDTRVGEMVASALRAQGLTVGWDGDPRSRIEVAVPRWRRPLPT